MPTISVVVPVYKVEQYLERCVDSILSQTFTDFELILVDDGSPDNCGAMCDAYAAKDARVQVIHQENQGQAAARNHGVQSAKGNWISFVDSDDMIHPQLLEILYNGVMLYNAETALCSMTEFSVQQPEFQEQNTQYTLLEENREKRLEKVIKNGGTRYWVPCGKLLLKDLLIRFPFTEGRVYEDNAIVFRWLHAAKDVVDCSNPLYFYFQNEQGTTRAPFSEKRLDYLWALKQQIMFYRKHRYQELQKIIECEYVRCVILFHKKTIEELNRKDLARMICKQYRKLKINAAALPLTEYEKECVTKIMHPYQFKFKTWIHNTIKKG